MNRPDRRRSAASAGSRPCGSPSSESPDVTVDLDLGDGIAIVGAGIGGLTAALSLHADRRRRDGVRSRRRDPPSRRRHQPAPPLDPRTRRARPARPARRPRRRTDDARVLRQERSRDLERATWPSCRISLAAAVDPSRRAAPDTARRRARPDRQIERAARTPTDPRRSTRRAATRAAATATFSCTWGLRPSPSGRRRSSPPTASTPWHGRSSIRTRDRRSGAGRCSWRGRRRSRAGARRAHDDLDRPPGAEVHRLPDRRPRATADRRSTSSPNSARPTPPSPTGRTGTGGATSPTSCPRSRAGSSTGSTCPR